MKLEDINYTMPLYMELSDRANLGFGCPTLEAYSNRDIAIRIDQIRIAESGVAIKDLVGDIVTKLRERRDKTTT